MPYLAGPQIGSELQELVFKGLLDSIPRIRELIRLAAYSPYQNQLGFRLNSILFDNKEWPSTLLHTHVFASSTALFFRIITISMFTFTD